MNRKEKLVMNFLCNKCQQKRAYLISPQEIATALSKKYILSIEEIDEIMITLSTENYLFGDGQFCFWHNFESNF